MKNKGNRHKLILLILVVLPVMLAACNKTEEPSVAPPPPPPPKNAQAAKPAPPVQQPLTSAQSEAVGAPANDFTGKKDPFKPFVVEPKPIQPLFKGGTRGLLPIQNYEVSQFKVLGIIVGLKQNSALVVDPAGKAYVVKPGMEIGKNGGQVDKITATTIEVIENYRDENGKLRKRTVKLTLPKKE